MMYTRSMCLQLGTNWYIVAANPCIQGRRYQNANFVNPLYTHSPYTITVPVMQNFDSYSNFSLAYARVLLKPRGKYTEGSLLLSSEISEFLKVWVRKASGTIWTISFCPVMQNFSERWSKVPRRGLVFKVDSIPLKCFSRKNFSKHNKAYSAFWKHFRWK